MTNPQVILPMLCKSHQRLIVRRLKLKPQDMWQANMVIVQLLIFSRISGDERIYKLTGGDATKMTEAFEKIGCTGCYNHPLIAKAVELIRRRGLDYASVVARGKAPEDTWYQ